MAIEVSWNQNKSWNNSKNQWNSHSNWNKNSNWSQSNSQWTEAQWAEWNKQQAEKKQGWKGQQQQAQHKNVVWTPQVAKKPDYKPKQYQKPKAVDALEAWGVVARTEDPVEVEVVEIEATSKLSVATVATTIKSESSGPQMFCIADESDDEIDGDDEEFEAPVVVRRVTLNLPAEESKPSVDESPASTADQTPCSAAGSPQSTTSGVSSTLTQASKRLSQMGKWAAIACDSDDESDDEF